MFWIIIVYKCVVSSQSIESVMYKIFVTRKRFEFKCVESNVIDCLGSFSDIY